MSPLLIQIIGGVGVVCLAASFQKNNRSFTLMSQLVGSVFFLIHFILLGAWTGAAMNVIAALRSYVFNQRDKKKWANHNATIYVIIGLFVLAGVLTWQGPTSILPVVAMSLECTALWSKSTKKMRWIYVCARPGWIAYDFIVGSYAGLIAEAFIVTSLLTAIFRFDRAKK